MKALSVARPRRDSLAGHGEPGHGVDQFVAHQAHEPAHPLLLDQVAGQAQVLGQAAHTLEIMTRKLLIKQAHELQAQLTFARGLVVVAAYHFAMAGA